MLRNHVKEIYGIDISPQFVSRVTDEMQQQVTEWQNRALDPIYPIVFVDGLRVSVRTKKGVLKKSSTRCWASTQTAARKCWACGSKRLKARASGSKSSTTSKHVVADVLIVCGDDLTGLRQAVESAYPDADVQLCVVHHIRNVTKFVSWKDRKALCASMRPIYTRPPSRRPHWHWSGSIRHGAKA